MKLTTIAALAFLCMHGFMSCKKNDQAFSPPDPPPPPVTGGAPSALSYQLNDYDRLNMSFKYAELPGKVSVYIDDTLTTDPYDRLFAAYTFNSDGYLTGNISYLENGDVLHDISVLRDNNVISSVIVKHIDNDIPGTFIIDTFHVHYADSAGGYTIMDVDYGDYFDGVPVNMQFTYLNHKITATTAGLYTLGDNSVFFPSFNYAYNASGSLAGKWSDSYYGTNFLYQETGSGLDSLFKLLGGKDWHYLESILNYDENTSLFFYPLYINLSKGAMDLDIYMHQYGPILQVHSVPSGSEYPVSEAFDFQNTFDDKERLIKTIIINNGLEYGTYQFSY